MRILDSKDNVLHTNKIPLVKVLWRNHSAEEVTGEKKKDMKEL